MLELNRHHDFQVFLSPVNNDKAITNPPSFNWPQQNQEKHYKLELEHCGNKRKWLWENATSPFQLPFLLESGLYRWRLSDSHEESSVWFQFTIDETVNEYLAPTAKELFDCCRNKPQFLMYLDEDIDFVRQASSSVYLKFKQTAKLAVDINKVDFPVHYRRGQEAGKRTAITNVREWIDRDLIALTMLYKIWHEEESGTGAVELLLAIAQWSPEGPASLLRPCTWGDEVGLSLSRNLFLAYHWLSPLLTESEKDFVRPMLIRIAYQMEERLNQDEFHQFPGHSHTSRLPAYLGIAALALHKEFDQTVCERWLNYALMIYRGVLPFYGGRDGSWAEGPFYSSSYSKWQHPFFLSVERLSDFSFYNHPFYMNYCQFAMDFVVSEQDIHPFGDGFWCKRQSVEWPGFFAQNPLRIYAERFGNRTAIETSNKLEDKIERYDLHLLDVVPTVKQLAYRKCSKSIDLESLNTVSDKSHFYSYAGFGIAKFDKLSLVFRASQFGNSSHRHADQGNIALFDQNLGILVPTGSYGYCFGSSHHANWTRTTQAHNLPLINYKGQILDDECATAKLLQQLESNEMSSSTLDLTKSYSGVKSFIRTMILVKNKGLIILDNIQLPEKRSVQWRLHSQLTAELNKQAILLSGGDTTYHCGVWSDNNVIPKIEFGHPEEIPLTGGVQSDATNDVYHLEWDMPPAKSHIVFASCLSSEIKFERDANDEITIELQEGGLVINKKTGLVNLELFAY